MEFGAESAQALMDLGATVCLARIPRCGACPLALGCPSRGRRYEPRRRQGPFEGSFRVQCAAPRFSARSPRPLAPSLGPRFRGAQRPRGGWPGRGTARDGAAPGIGVGRIGGDAGRTYFSGPRILRGRRNPESERVLFNPADQLVATHALRRIRRRRRRTGQRGTADHGRGQRAKGSQRSCSEGSSAASGAVTALVRAEAREAGSDSPSLRASSRLKVAVSGPRAGRGAAPGCALPFPLPPDERNRLRSETLAPAGEPQPVGRGRAHVHGAPTTALTGVGHLHAASRDPRLLADQHTIRIRHRVTRRAHAREATASSSSDEIPSVSTRPTETTTRCHRARPHREQHRSTRG